MLQKILYTILLLVLCFSNSFAGNGFFIEGGIGSRYMNGNMNYQSRINSDYQSDFELSRDPLNEASLDYSVTDQSMLGWKSKLVGNYNATIGFRFSEIFVSSISAHYVHEKGGFSRFPSWNYPNVNTNLGENIERGILTSTVETNWFSQLNLRATQQIYLNSSLYLISGVEYSFLAFKKKGQGLPYTRDNQDGVIYEGTSFDVADNSVTYKDNTFGLLAGIGFELPISHKMSLMTTGIYVISSYKGDELYYSGLDFNIGGFELGYTLRYYLK